MGKAKLHEVLAVEKDLQEAARKVIDEAVVTFTKKQNLFIGSLKRVEMFDESRQHEFDALKEHNEVTTTVPNKLKYVSNAIGKYYDIIGKKEITNQSAKADIVLDDGTVLLTDMPATLLLGLESRLIKVREMYNVIPTLPPGIIWEEDKAAGNHIYKTAEDQEKNKTEKKIEYEIVVPATKEHPAQIRERSEDKPVGKFISTHWYGMITPAKKSVLIGRIDELIRCIKKARTRANSTEVTEKKIGKSIFDFINS